MNDQVTKALRLRLDELSNVTAAGKQHAGARLGQIHNSEAEEQGHGRDDFKIKQSLRAHAPNLFQITTAGNTDNQRRKN